MADFIELDRRFQETVTNSDGESAARASYASQLFSDETGLAWSDVLGHRFVVVLGEPGSGKTAEFKAQASLPDPQGIPRFFVRLEYLIQGSLDTALGTQQSFRFRDWLSGNREALFFLDSVDETKYRRNDDFTRALERLAITLGKAQSRTRIAISSRISEWQPQTDKDTVLRVFGLPDKKDGQSPIKVVQIMPFDRGRVEKYAKEKGKLASPQDFVTALDEQHAWAFARRPVDVIPLFNYWNEHHRLGTLTELIEYGLKSALAETENREISDVLSLTVARLGVEALAAAATFCKQFKIVIPDNGFVADDGALDAKTCLPNHWTPDMRRALLTRAVFDAATYGHIRFHHRDVLDYLAAGWVATLMNADCPLDTLEDLLFEVGNENRVLRPSLAPIAAWLAVGDEPWRNRLREWIKQAAPQTFLQHGDAANLLIEYRRQLLHAIVARYEGREHVRLDWSAEALSRLASPELASDINEILKDDNVVEDLKSDMLSLARHGALRDCIPVAIEIAGSDNASDSLKSYAVALIRDIGSAADRRQLAATINKYPRFSTILSGRLCEALYPAALDAKGLANLLTKTDGVSRYSIDLPYYLREHLETHLMTPQAFDMLEEILRLIDTPPYERDTELSERFLWVANLFPICLRKLLEQPQLSKPKLKAASRAISILAKAGQYGLLEGDFCRNSSGSKEISRLLAQHPELQREVFLDRTRRWKEKHGSYPHRYAPLELGNIELGLSNSDISWLLQDVDNSHLPPEERSFAARILLEMPANIPNFLRRVLRMSRSNVDGVRTEARRSLRLKLIGPFIAFWYRQVKHKLADHYWWKQRYRNSKRWYERLHSQWVLYRHINWLRTGKRLDWLAHLTRESKNQTKWSPEDWTPLQEKRGKRIAEAVRVGCETFWPRYSPLLPHEKQERSQIDGRVIVGLAGLQSQWQKGTLDFAQLTDEEVRRATRYGCEELNGLPEWFFTLGHARPEPWLEVLNDAIRGEWSTPASQEHVNDVIAKLVWHGRPYWSAFAPFIHGLLDESDPPHPQVLEYVLTILLGGDADTSRLAKLARQRLADYGPDDRHCVLWLSVWLQIDAIAALDFLDQVLEGIPPAEADDLLVRLCASMKQDRYDPSPVRTLPDYALPNALGRFIRLVYRHVRPKEDIDRAGTGAYSPGPRDHAQEFRSTLFEMLSNSDHHEADAVLRSLLDAPELIEQRDWILHLLDKRQERAADLAPWRQSEIQTFAKEHEITPNSSHALFRIAYRRFADIKREVEGVENSLRNAVRTTDDESVMQQWLQRELSERAKGKYTIPKEVEDDAGNRPDLRFDHPGITSVMVEIKLADMPHWTLENLVSGLETQLVGQYLLAHHAAYGIYVLGNSGRRVKGWEDRTTGLMLSFDELVSRLRDHALKVKETHPEILGLEIVSIDFSSPRKT